MRLVGKDSSPNSDFRFQTVPLPGVVSIIKPAWPLVGVAVILLGAALLIGK